jgi:N-acetyl-gamma-glutamyl-phosphate reductase
VNEGFEEGARRRVAVAGSMGYAGAGLVAMLGRHPEVELVQVASRSQAGQRHREVYPGSECDLTMVEEVNPAACDVVLAALPAGEVAIRTGAWLEQGAAVIDIGPDFRLADPRLYRQWYGVEHARPDLLAQAVLALPELEPGALTGASLMALPGCFSTAAILGCGPAVVEHLVEPEVLVDAKSGISGAGRQAGSSYLFPELDQTVLAYSVGGHRHRPEMELALTRLAGEACSVIFVPHLVPMTRGIVATCYLTLRPGVSLEDAQAAYRHWYAAAPFLRLGDQPASSKLTAGTNLCYLSLHQQGDRLIVCSVLDNLGRGASSQAVQVLNQRFGLTPTAGLEQAPRWP